MFELAVASLLVEEVVKGPHILELLFHRNPRVRLGQVRFLLFEDWLLGGVSKIQILYRGQV